jgi:hypothetical protein
MLENFKKIDAFPKAFDDFRVKTKLGAIGTNCICYNS